MALPFFSTRLLRLIPFVVFALVLYYLYTPQDTTDNLHHPKFPAAPLTNISRNSYLHHIPQTPSIPPPKITLIAIWSPTPNAPVYLHNFFASVASNPDVDVLFIKYDKHRIGCEDLVGEGMAGNVREVCLSIEEYWDLHMEFLCEKWNCDDVERSKVRSKLNERAPQDRVNSYFRPLRAPIFAQYLHPDLTLWGWCDMDTIFGDFSSTFPWDVASDFDMFQASSLTEPDDVLLYFTGHMAMFRNADYVTEEFMKFRTFRGIKEFSEAEWVGPDPDEGEYSWHLLTQTNLTFLRFPAMVANRYHLSTVSAPGPHSPSSVYSIPDHWKWSTAQPHLLDPANKVMRASLTQAIHSHKRSSASKSSKTRKTFSDEGREYEVALRIGAYQGHLWYPQRYAVDFIRDPSSVPGVGLKYVIRRVAHGPIYHRVEPVDHDSPMVIKIPAEAYTKPGEEQDGSLEVVVAIETLYTHFHAEKYKAWWDLPHHAITRYEVLYVDVDRGAWVWDSTGKITFKTDEVAAGNDAVGT